MRKSYKKKLRNAFLKIKVGLILIYLKEVILKNLGYFIFRNFK
jgi:hypothetical protein